MKTPARKIFSSGIFMKLFLSSNRVYSCCLNKTKTSKKKNHKLLRLLFLKNICGGGGVCIGGFGGFFF